MKVRQQFSWKMAAGTFECCDEKCFFPYLFKHGTILKITEEEYDRLKSWDWETEEE